MIPSPPDMFSASRDPKASPTILVVEDEVLLRLWITEELRNGSFTVLEATSAVEAMEVLNSAAQVNLVLVVMREQGGIDQGALAEWVRRHRPDVKLLVEPGNTGPPGADAFAVKYSNLEVIQAIRKLLGREEIQRSDRSRERRQIAAECLASAQKTTDLAIRASLVSIAQKWLDLAERASRQRDAVDIRAIQTRLGQELRALYELPQKLPHRLFMLLIQLDEQPDGGDAQWN
jgi:CheY-like chemotaxis protein